MARGIEIMNLTEKILADVADDLWEQEVEQEVKDLMVEGAEYYPFKWQNMREAIGELNSTEWIMLASWLHVSHKSHERVHKSKHAAGNCGYEMIDMIIKYWTKQAREQAEKNVNRRM